jgi:hypothetical protein
VKKRLQLDNLSEMPKEKRPPDYMIWWGTSEDLEDWIDNVYSVKEKQQEEFSFMIPEENVE